jgi:hypothetical protein
MDFKEQKKYYPNLTLKNWQQELPKYVASHCPSCGTVYDPVEMFIDDLLGLQKAELLEEVERRIENVKVDLPTYREILGILNSMKE